MAYRVGESITDYIDLFDAAGTAITGASFTTTTQDPSGSSFTLTVTEQGGGRYRVRFTATEAGQWYWRAVFAGTPVQIFHETYDVDSATLTTPATVSSPTGITRKQLRRDILRSAGDLRILTATSNGSDVTFFDAKNLNGEVNAFAGREVLFTGGTVENLGEIRYVVSSSANQRGIGFATLPAATATGDEAEMINTRGINFRFDEVHEAINQAIRGIADQALVPATSEEVTYTRGEGIELPDEFVTIENVQWQSSADSTKWRSVPKATRLNGMGWAVDRATREIVIGGQTSWTLSGRTVKVWGLARPAELTSDTDTSPLDPEWLRTAAQAILAEGAYLQRPTPEKKDALSLLSGKEYRLRRKLGTSQGAFSEAV